MRWDTGQICKNNKILNVTEEIISMTQHKVTEEKFVIVLFFDS